jgi:hypothetical protein
MKKIILILSVVFFSLQYSIADEGMWLLTMLNKTYPQMKAEGFKLTPQDIYNVNKASLKDAVVIFGGFCTGEIVSNKGLVFTNHHCGFGSIQSHSSVEHDYLTNGFWAKSYKEELPNPGLYVKFLIRMDDVTSQVLKGVKDNMSEAERDKIIQKNIQKIQKNAMKKYDKKKGYEASVKSIFHNNQYLLFIYQKYDDVRLVAAPPESIGKFGGDTDNWMWTRHTGDFSVFRVYTAPDGSPAKYSPKNIPLKPKYVMPISLKGEKQGDYAQIMGYPGRTERYAPTYGIEQIMNVVNNDRKKIRGIRQQILWKDMMADKSVFIKYASKYAISSNYWKYSIGQNQALKRLHILKSKKALEDRFTKWIATNPKLEAKYKNVLPTFKSVYAGRKDYLNTLIYLSECFLRGTEYVHFAASAKKLYTMLQKKAKNKDIKAQIKNLKIVSAKFFKDYNAPTDKKASLAMLKLYAQDINPKFYPDFIPNVKSKYSTFDNYINNVFDNSIFVSQAKFDKFLQSPTLGQLQKDPAFTEYLSVAKKYSEMKNKMKTYDQKLQWAYRLWMEGLMKMEKNKLFYPDANFTMRLTYGQVKGYSPRDAVIYRYYTTLKGVMEKEDPNNPDFIVPKKLKELYKTKDYGQYADADGTMHVCFLTNNDITGGNSGSPVINGNGQLIGLAFDGNWEAMSGDIAFDPQLQRTICVDIRYVLFIIDKYGNDKRLIKELDLVK